MALAKTMHTVGITSLIALSALCTPVQAAGEAKTPRTVQLAANTPTPALDREALRLRSVLRRYDRAMLITVSGKATKSIQPDQMTIQVKLSGFGEDVGAVVLALNSQKKEMLKAAEKAADQMVSAHVTSLDVREDRRRRRDNARSQDAYQGHMQLSLTMKFAGDPLELIAKVTNGRVDAISRTRFEVSEGDVDTKELKAAALADARKEAQEKAELLGTKLGQLLNVNYHETPRRSSYGHGPSMVTVRATATFQRADGNDN